MFEECHYFLSVYKFARRGRALLSKKTSSWNAPVMHSPQNADEQRKDASLQCLTMQKSREQIDTQIDTKAGSGTGAIS